MHVVPSSIPNILLDLFLTLKLHQLLLSQSCYNICTFYTIGLCAYTVPCRLRVELHIEISSLSWVCICVNVCIKLTDSPTKLTDSPAKLIDIPVQSCCFFFSTPPPLMIYFSHSTSTNCSTQLYIYIWHLILPPREIWLLMAHTHYFILVWWH